MKLAADGREYVHYEISTPLTQGAPSAAEVELATGVWTSLAFVSQSTTGDTIKSVWRVLVAGPDADTADSVALPLKTTRTRIRITNGLESVVRAAGNIDVG